MSRSRGLLLVLGVVATLSLAQVALLAFERSDPDRFRMPVASTPTPTPAPTPAPPPQRQPQREEVVPLNKDDRYWHLMDHTESMLQMHRDQPLHADEEYNQAFLYLLTDQMGALRVVGRETGTRQENTGIINDFGRKIDLLEERYIAGEPLGTDVHIRRGDGSEFTYDGRTAPRRS